VWTVSAGSVGSSNINKYSLDNSLEVGVVIENAQSLLLLSDIVETVLAVSHSVRNKYSNGF